VRCLWSLDRDLAYARHYPAVSWAGSFSRDDDVIAAWHAAEGDPDWAQRRARLGGLLAEADRLGSLAELMGVSALPPPERATILAGRLIREGLLQQSALSPVDASCDSARAAALADAVLAVAGRCQELARSGVPAAAIEETDFSTLLRAREDAARPAEVADRERVMIATLDRLSEPPEPPAEPAEPARPPAEAGSAA
jgi:V/A-type H+-transporting ATPase subunit A